MAQASLLWFIWLGDLSGFMESLIIAAPTTLQQLSFNREAEYQADNIAVKHLQTMGISSGCLTTALKKITADFDEPPEYLSTHPHTEKRIKDLEVSCYRL